MDDYLELSDDGEAGAGAGVSPRWAGAESIDPTPASSAKRSRGELAALKRVAKEREKENLKREKDNVMVAEKRDEGRFGGAELALHLSPSLASMEAGRAIVALAAQVYDVASRRKEGDTESVASGSGGRGADTNEASMRELSALQVLPPSPRLELARDAPTLHWKRGVVKLASECHGGGSGSGSGSGSGGGSSLVFPVPTIFKRLKESLVADFSEAEAVPRVAVVLSGEAWVGMIFTHKAQGVIGRVGAWKAALPITPPAPAPTLQILLHGLSAAVSAKLREARKANQGGDGGDGGLSMEALAALHTHLFITLGVQVSSFDSLPQLTQGVMRLTRFLGEAPYAKPLSELDNVTKKKGDTPWIMMLESFPRVSPKIATAIADKFPTCKALMDAYASHRLTEKAKVDLLADVLGGGGGGGGEEEEDEEGGGGGGGKGGSKKPKRLTKLSADLHSFFTNREFTTILGPTEK